MAEDKVYCIMHTSIADHELFFFIIILNFAVTCAPFLSNLTAGGMIKSTSKLVDIILPTNNLNWWHTINTNDRYNPCNGVAARPIVFIQSIWSIRLVAKMDPSKSPITT